MKRQRSPLLIIGAHRSGTSATARALELMGLQIGQRLDSHREPRGLRKLHEDYLCRLGAAWHDPERFLKWIKTADGKRDCVAYLRENMERDFRRIFGYRADPKGIWLRVRRKFGGPWGWKEPRTTLFAPAWLEIFPEARILHVVRDVEAAASSIRERELKFQAAGDPPTGNLANLDYCRRLVEIYLNAGDRLSNIGEYRRVEFDQIQTNAPAMLEQIGKFCQLQFTIGQLASAAATIRPPANQIDSRSLKLRRPADRV
jgi:Sulfotransferase family